MTHNGFENFVRNLDQRFKYQNHFKHDQISLSNLLMVPHHVAIRICVYAALRCFSAQNHTPTSQHRCTFRGTGARAKPWCLLIRAGSVADSLSLYYVPRHKGKDSLPTSVPRCKPAPHRLYPNLLCTYSIARALTCSIRALSPTDRSKSRYRLNRNFMLLGLSSRCVARSSSAPV